MERSSCVPPDPTPSSLSVRGSLKANIQDQLYLTPVWKQAHGIMARWVTFPECKPAYHSVHHSKGLLKPADTEDQEELHRESAWSNDSNFSFLTDVVLLRLHDPTIQSRKKSQLLHSRSHLCLLLAGVGQNSKASSCILFIGKTKLPCQAMSKKDFAIVACHKEGRRSCHSMC